MINKKDNRNYLLITVTNIKVIDRIFSQFNDHNVEVSNINFEKTNQDDTVITLDLLPGKTTVIDQLYHDLLAIEHVKQVRNTKTV